MHELAAEQAPGLEPKPSNDRPRQTEAAAAAAAFSCVNCGKAYTRADHLDRHRQSHSHVKPFACGACGKDFTRADVLKRHMASHRRGALTKKHRFGPVRHRSRAAKACQSCAAAKLKCEDEKPCTRCLRKKIPCLSGETRWLVQCNDARRQPSRESNQADEETNSIRPINQASLEVTDPLMSPNSSADNSSCEATSHVEAAGTHNISAAYPESFLQNSNLLPELGGQDMIDFSASSMNTGASFDEFSLETLLDSIMSPRQYATPNHITLHDNLPSNQIHDFPEFDSSWAGFTLSEMMADAVNQLEEPRADTETSDSAQGTPSGDYASLTSLFWWTPTMKDHAGADKADLSLPPLDMESPETQAASERSFLPKQRLDNALRDKILALVLSTCDPSIQPKVTSSFPSAELLDNLMSFYLVTHHAQKDSWLHLPTIEISENTLELVIMLVAAGAVICSVPSIRKLGLAFQEVSRSAIARKMERDNRFTRDLPSLQALALLLQVGLWSGDKRKTELAESHFLVLITLLRRAGRFRRVKDTSFLPTVEDSDETLEMKWRNWVHAESYKRLACQSLIHDVQSSMAQQIAPVLSPTDLTIDFPASRQLWTAHDASNWRSLYLLLNVFAKNDQINIAQGIRNVSKLRDSRYLDNNYAVKIVVYSAYALVYSTAQLHALIWSESQGHDSGDLFATRSYDHGIPMLLDQLCMTISDWDSRYDPETALVFERILTGLYVPFEQVYLFAGKEGEDEARRVFPLLRQWAASCDARKAIWHAGQVLKAAGQCNTKCLRDFQAVCVYHAGVTLWAYALVSAVGSEDGQTQSSILTTIPATPEGELLWLDGDDCAAIQRFIGLRRGTPVIRKRTGGSSDGSVTLCLGNIKTIMDICIETLTSNWPAESRGYLPLVGKLTDFMRHLGNAAEGLLRCHLKRLTETID